jgi:hypothetical protein
MAPLLGTSEPNVFRVRRLPGGTLGYDAYHKTAHLFDRHTDTAETAAALYGLLVKSAQNGSSSWNHGSKSRSGLFGKFPGAGGENRTRNFCLEGGELCGANA